MRAVGPMEHAIPRQNWQAFCDEFSRQHGGWHVSVHVSRGDETRTIAAEVALLGVMFDASGAAITLSAGHGQRALTHRVPAPRDIRLRLAPDGAHDGLAIDADDGTCTVVRFMRPTQVEILDGVLR